MASSSLIEKQMDSANRAEQIVLLDAKLDAYDGVTVEMKEPMDSNVFSTMLKASISQWRQQGKKGVWIKLPIQLAYLIEAAVKEGFWYHHAEATHLIAETPRTIPANASHRVGIAAVVMNDNGEVMNNVAPAHRVNLDLGLGDEHYWTGSTKLLTSSDVNNQGRLLCPRENFPTTMNQYLKEQCRTVGGQRFKVEDVDTGTSYMLTLKRWQSGSFVWTTYWNKDFVKRRSLKVNDVIGLLYDSSNSMFYFSVRERGLNNIVNE